MQIIPTALPEVSIIVPQIFADERGYFFENFEQTRYVKQGFVQPFVQDNFSHSVKNVLRGLHYQRTKPQGKLVSVTQGVVFDVAVDIRHGSPRFGQWVGVLLDDKEHKQLYIPPGFAHGFCVLSETADFIYKVTDYYDPTSEYGIYWQDSQLGIDWPVKIPLVSKKDAAYPALVDIDVKDLPAYTSKCEK